jgi:hypothetical protein
MPIQNNVLFGGNRITRFKDNNPRLFPKREVHRLLNKIEKSGIYIQPAVDDYFEMHPKKHLPGLRQLASDKFELKLKTINEKAKPGYRLGIYVPEGKKEPLLYFQTKLGEEIKIDFKKQGERYLSRNQNKRGVTPLSTQIASAVRCVKEDEATAEQQRKARLETQRAADEADVRSLVAREQQQVKPRPNDQPPSYEELGLSPEAYDRAYAEDLAARDRLPQRQVTPEWKRLGFRNEDEFNDVGAVEAYKLSNTLPPYSDKNTKVPSNLTELSAQAIEQQIADAEFNLATRLNIKQTRADQIHRVASDRTRAQVKAREAEKAEKKRLDNSTAHEKDHKKYYEKYKTDPISETNRLLYKTKLWEDRTWGERAWWYLGY